MSKREVFRWAEAEGKSRQGRGKEHQSHHADCSGDIGSDGSDSKGRSCPTLLSHGIAVDAGHHRGGFSGDPHQDGGGGAPVHGTVIDPGKENDGGSRVQAEGGREENADSGERTNPWQNTHQGSDQTADEGIEEI